MQKFHDKLFLYFFKQAFGLSLSLVCAKVLFSFGGSLPHFRLYTLFQNGGCLRRSGSSSTRARHRGPRFNVYMFTCGSIIRNMPQNCCVPGCKKKVYEEDGVKISFHKFPEDRELFRKWIVAIRRDVSKEFRVTDHTRV